MNSLLISNLIPCLEKCREIGLRGITTINNRIAIYDSKLIDDKFYGVLFYPCDGTLEIYNDKVISSVADDTAVFISPPPQFITAVYNAWEEIKTMHYPHHLNYFILTAVSAI